MKFFLTLALAFFIFHLSAEEPLLQQQLKKGQKGDFIVLMQGKTCTLLHLVSLNYPYATLEEVTISGLMAPKYVSSWRNWIAEGAPKNSSWIIYQLNLEKGTIDRFYSVAKQCYFTVPEEDNFFHTLIHLDFTKISDSERKKVGFSRTLWAPKMVFESQTIPQVPFDAYFGKWPEDGGPLSGKGIEIYLPQESDKYPSYFPYWMEVRGVIGPSKVRVIESGRNLISPTNGFTG